MTRSRRMKPHRNASARRTFGLGLIAAGPLILTLLRGMFAAAPVFSADAPPGFAAATGGDSAPPELTGTVVLSDGTEYASARITARADLTLEVFCGPDNERKSLLFSEISEVRQVVAEEGRQPEWRWKEGGGNEKIFTGREYHWRKLTLELRLKNGDKLSGKLGRGVALTMDATTAQGEKVRRQLILQPQQKGEPGEAAAPVFVARITLE